MNLNLAAELQRCRPWLEAALEHTDGSHAIEDIEAAVLRGDLQLVPQMHSAMVLDFERHPQCNVITVFLAGGDLDELLGLDPWLEDIARAKNATLRLIGREGWVRPGKALGWTKKAVLLVKDPR